MTSGGAMTSGSSAASGRVIKILPFSSVDGPGNRSVVFLAGCNFNCLACHNPQTIPMVSPESRELTAAEVLSALKPARPFISGITVSGGEPTLQADFLEELLAGARALGVHTLIDSNGSAPTAVWERLLPVAGGVALDLKAIDPALHRRLTGHALEPVLDSIRFAASKGKLAEVRHLVIPGFTDALSRLQQLAAWLASVAPDAPLALLAFRHHGVRGELASHPSPAPQQMAALVDAARAAGVKKVSIRGL
ncbi:MAG: radical SAM protein [Firmicutes bacterium]|nr:radical SAM protein [Bacillota bacterium]